jgi:hypothetical protein
MSNASSDSSAPHPCTDSSVDQVAEPVDAHVAAALKAGPRGALVLASISVGLLFVGWLTFYFLLFMPRGSVD